MPDPAAPTAETDPTPNLNDGASPQSVRRLARVQNGFLLFGLALLPIALVLAHKAVGVLLLIGGLLVAASPSVWHNTPYTEKKWRALSAGPLSLFFFLGLCLWLGVTALWSTAPKAFTLFLIPLGTGLSALALSRWLLAGPTIQAQRLLNVFALAIIASAVLLSVEAITGGAIRLMTPPDDLSWNRHKDIGHLGRGVTILVLMVFPAALVLRARQGHWLGLAMLSALAFYVGVTFTISANVLGLAAGLIAFVCALGAPRTTLLVLTALILGFLILMPAIAAWLPAEMLHARWEGTVPASWLQRLYVWKAVGAEIVTGLPFGHGVDYARILTGTTPTIEIAGAVGPLQVFPIHPHSVFLQLWLEGGLPAVLLAAGALIFGVNALLRTSLSPPTLAGFAGVMAASLVSFAVEASLWQLWRPAGIGVAIAALIACERAGRTS